MNRLQSGIPIYKWHAFPTARDENSKQRGTFLIFSGLVCTPLKEKLKDATLIMLLMIESMKTFL